MARRARRQGRAGAGLRRRRDPRARVTDRTRVVALCNPNDPTGDYWPAGAAAAARRAARARGRAARRGAARLRRRRAARRLARAARRATRACSSSAPSPRPRAWPGCAAATPIGGPGLRAAARADRAGARRRRPRPGRRARGAAQRLARRSQRRARSVATERARLLAALGAAGVDVTPSQANVLWLRATASTAPSSPSRLRARRARARRRPARRPATCACHDPDAEATDRLLRALALAVGDDDD